MLVVLAVVLVALGAVGVSSVYRYAHREVPVAGDPACPALLTNTSNAAEDFADVVTWAGRTYVRADDGPDWALSDVTGVVGCSIGEMDNPSGLRVADGPWPDGTATRLPRGTELHLTGDRTLVASEPGGPTLYCVADPTTLEPEC